MSVEVHEPIPDSAAPAVRLLRKLFGEAAARQASDIHIEPYAQTWRIRLRIDGRLYETERPAVHLRDALVACIKVLAGLDIAEKRVPQDGRLALADDRGEVGAFRVSTLPTVRTERVVLRRLDTLPADLSPAALGLDAAQQAAFDAVLACPHGMVVIAGPTGCGKTLSLYGLLNRLDRDALNVCAVEDPSEIALRGVTQVSVRAKAGLTFAKVMRAFLRQDPDVIMVGEIRDAETADVAVKAAQTGHLVLATLHADDAPASIARLLDLGVAPVNLQASLRLVSAQRLLRKLCPHCRVPVDDAREQLRLAGFTGDAGDAGWRPYDARGCAACGFAGYRGRLGVHQVMHIDDALRQMIAQRAGTHALRRQAAAAGLATLRQAALTRVRSGDTSVAEVVAATAP